MYPISRHWKSLSLATALIAFASPTLAQKQGGMLHLYHRDSPASMSILEEATISTVMPVMGVFNNLVMFDQRVPQNSLNSIVPDLAESWSWGEDGKSLTFKLRTGIKWHDGKPFTANDVKCTCCLAKAAPSSGSTRAAPGTATLKR